MEMKEFVFNSLSPHLNLTLFDVSSNQELIDLIDEKRYPSYNRRYQRLHNAYFKPRRKLKHFEKRSLSNNNSPKQENPAVLYMNLGSQQNKIQYHCPTSADSSAVSLAQMAFLSMTVSIFTVVASIANNINNNNNNNNNNNLNFVKQKTQSVSQNQNVVNQINIDLPPPVPGRKKRSYSLDYRLQKRSNFIKDFMETEEHSPETTRRSLKCDSTRLSVIKALENMAKAGMKLKGFKEEPEDIKKRQQCFGRELCIRMLEDRNDRKLNYEQSNTFKNIVNEFETLFLMYHQLSDPSIAFTDFLEDVRYNEEPKYFIGCYDMFPNC